MFVSTLRLSEAEVFADELVVLTIVPRFTHPDLDNSCEKGAVARSPFDIQFISASSTGTSQSIVRWLEGRTCSVALIVLRAFASSPLSAFYS